jgi:hypothetical protein
MAIAKSLSGSYTLGFNLLAIVAAICLIVLAAIGRGTAKPATRRGLRRSGAAVTHS